MKLSLLEIKMPNLPLKDCKVCMFNHQVLGELRPREDEGHCYMFKEKPPTPYCGQFKKESFS